MAVYTVYGITRLPGAPAEPAVHWVVKSAYGFTRLRRLPPPADWAGVFGAAGGKVRVVTKLFPRTLAFGCA